MDILEHYQTLGLPADASETEAKQAYRKLVNRWHPDRFARDNALQRLAEEHLKHFNIAYAAVKKHISSRTGPSRSRPAGTAGPGLRRRRSQGNAGAPTVLNRLTRKFRQALSSFQPLSGRQTRGRTPAGVKPPGSSTGHRVPPQGRADVNRRKNFDEIFREIAGPEAIQIKKNVALKKKSRYRKSGPSSPLLRTVSRTPAPRVSRVKRVVKIKRI